MSSSLRSLDTSGEMEGSPDSAQGSPLPSADQNQLKTHLPPKPASAETCDEIKATLEEICSTDRGEVTCSIPIVELESFLSYLFPPLRDGIDLESITASLRGEGSIIPTNNWKTFETSGEEKDGDEEIVSVAFLGIFHAIVNVAMRRANIEPNFVLALSDIDPSTDQITKKMSPGGYFILREAEERTPLSEEKQGRTRRWYDIALTTEFRSRNNARARNAVGIYFPLIYSRSFFFEEHEQDCAEYSANNGA